MTPVIPGPALANSLDLGEAAVIQVALDKGIPTVCIDEIVGRRIARLHGLAVTGSIGILLRAKEEGADFSMRAAMMRMQAKVIWLGTNVIDFALRQAGES